MIDPSDHLGRPFSSDSTHAIVVCRRLPCGSLDPDPYTAAASLGDGWRILGVTVDRNDDVHIHMVHTERARAARRHLAVEFGWST